MSVMSSGSPSPSPSHLPPDAPGAYKAQGPRGTRVPARIGTVLVAVPLALGVGMALVALTGRLGGPANALTALWYVPTETALIALIGALMLIAALWRSPARRGALVWTVTGLAGWVFAIESAQLSGLAHTPAEQSLPWQWALLGVGVVTYLVALVGLVRHGWRASR